MPEENEDKKKKKAKNDEPEKAPETAEPNSSLIASAAAKKAEEKKKAAEEKIRKAEIERILKMLGVKDDSVKPADQYEPVSHIISTGHGELDKILTPTIYDQRGCGGIPRGFVCEFFGPYAGGKTSLALMLAASVTRNKERVFWEDAEQCYVPDWANVHGVVNEYVYRMAGSKSAEEYLEKLETAAASGDFSLAVVDSVTALVTKQVLETPLDENARVAAMASLMSRALPRIVPAAKRGNCAVIFINQIRQKIGIMYGNPETTPGGEALRFFSSLRVRLSQVGGKNNRGIMKDGEEIGIRSMVQVVKSRFGPPFKDTVVPIYYTNEKPHPLDELLNLALAKKVVKCRSKKEGHESIQFFTLDYPDTDTLKGIEGFEDFKSKLDAEHIKYIAQKLADIIVLTPEIAGYLSSLEADPTK